MAELKTKPTDESVTAFLEGVEDDSRRQDCFELLELMREVSGQAPRLWGGSMVGFGSYHYKYASGREGDSFLTGFSPRKRNLTLYSMAGFDRYEELMDQLGKHKTGKSCLYIKELDDVDRDVLRTLIERSLEYMRSRYV
ncbi:MAG: DUF1801 domain-containing protein [Trueperaceae bacterium]